ncbi:hypothetical protein [Methylovirgula sp. 4M-Z18]|uniref:hypothetical protein n=1 Tax=Methylovirgula sp. 4M-Z18 TaxID=2293567 RepID=UPI000E2FAE7E|nr:hypothetical protein [Methylovirgula sp. 4M-Z18]RFB76428.1 hypothetical protein DYH55_20005 [Methylovirgula sp. 4M-Z18]
MTKFLSTKIVTPLLAGTFILSLAGSPGAQAQEAFAGTWTISKADTAPWASAPPKPDDELKLLMGKTVSFLKTRIDGPRPVRCAKLKYEIKDYTPDMLFQGTLSADPAKQAAALGFKGETIKTLETGCGNELDYHMVDANTVLFGLNDRVYTLARKMP